MKTAHWHALLLAGAGLMHFKAPQVPLIRGAWRVFRGK